ERGDWADALCPLHAEDDASFGVNLEHGGWICRHDDEGGQLVDLVMRLRELSRHEALAWMAGLGPSKDHSIDDLLRGLTGGAELEAHDPLAWAKGYLELETNRMAEYWFERGFTEDTMHAFGVRYYRGVPISPPHIIWPVKDADGNTISFMLRRVVDNWNGSKYLYPRGFERTLFPLDHFEGDEAVLVEGPLDAMWLHQHGYRGALALLGSGVTAGQEAWLRGQEKVSKAEVQAFLAANQLEVTETELGKPVPAAKTDKAWVAFDTRRPETQQFFDTEAEAQAFAGERSGWDHDSTMQGYVPGEKTTKFAEYTLPGGKNYRELLIQLPPPKEFQPVGAFTGGHYGEPNVLAHIRFNDRTG
ncbi:hypothetical protein LCGC14_3030240, partial [marine sediment metagenome]